MWRLDREWISGVLILVVGLVVLGERLVPDLVPVLPLAAGIVVLGVFFVLRTPGVLVTGSVLTGVGLGVLVARGSSQTLATPGFVASIGAGFLLAWVLGLLLGVRAVRTWPLIPGIGLLALAALLYVLDIGPEVLRLTARWWPLALVVIGALLMLGARQRVLLGGAGHEDETSGYPTGGRPPTRPQPQVRPLPPAEAAQGDSREPPPLGGEQPPALSPGYEPAPSGPIDVPDGVPGPPIRAERVMEDTGPTDAGG